MFCVNCGYPLNKGDKACSFCGNEITRSTANKSLESQMSDYHESESGNSAADIDDFDQDFSQLLEEDDSVQKQNQKDKQENKFISTNEILDEDDGLLYQKLYALEGIDNTKIEDKLKDIMVREEALHDEKTENNTNYDNFNPVDEEYSLLDFEKNDMDNNGSQNQNIDNVLFDDIEYMEDQNEDKTFEDMQFTDSQYNIQDFINQHDENGQNENTDYYQSTGYQQLEQNDVEGYPNSQVGENAYYKDNIEKTEYETPDLLNNGYETEDNEYENLGYETPDLLNNGQETPYYNDENDYPVNDDYNAKHEYTPYNTEEDNEEQDKGYNGEISLSKESINLETYFDDNALPEEEGRVQGLPPEIAGNEDDFMVGQGTGKGDPSAFLSKIVNKGQGLGLRASASANSDIMNEMNKQDAQKSLKIKLIIGGIVVGIGSIILLIRMIAMLSTDNKTPYITLETNSIVKSLTDLVNNSGKNIDAEISAVANKSVNSKYEFYNFEIDENSLKLFKLPELDQINEINKNMSIIWDKRILPKDKMVYNDYKINIKNGEYLRLQYFKRGDILKLMVPTVYPKIFVIDTSKMADFYKKVGITKSEGFSQKFLDENAVVGQLGVGKNIIGIGDIIKKLLTDNVEDQDVSLNTGVKYSVSETQLTADKYRVNISEAKTKIILKGILARLSKDEDVYKVVMGKYAAIVGVIKQLGLDDGKLNNLDKNAYLAYMTDLNSKVDKIKIENGMTATIWVDDKKNVVGRNYELTVKNDKGDTQKLTIYYNYLDSEAKKYCSLDIICEPKGASYKSMQVKFETNTKVDLMKTSSKNVTDYAKLVTGVLSQKDYTSFEILSDRSIVSDAESKRKYKLDFLSNGDKGDYKMSISAVGTERGTVSSLKLNGDYNVLYDISSTNPYKGKFEMKYDTMYANNIDLPVGTSPIVSDTAPIMELNNITEKALNEMYLDIQVKYKAYQRKIAELFGLKAAGQTRLN